MFIDIHAHAFRRPFQQIDGLQPFPTPAQLIEYYDRMNVQQAVLLPLIGPEFYLPQSNEDILEMAGLHPGRFIPFMNIHPRAIRNSSDAPLSEVMLKYKELGARGLGEVTCNLPILDPLVVNLFKQAEIAKLPVTIHLSHRIGNSYGLYDQPGLPGLTEILLRFPELKIMGHSVAFWAELSELRIPFDRARAVNTPVKEGVLPKMMRLCPNLYGDLSANSGCNALMRDSEYAVRFLTEFQDRLLFGLDICAPPTDKTTNVGKFLIQLREDGKIDDRIFYKIARDNAVKLLGL